jgi:hypothetical protein
MKNHDFVLILIIIFGLCIVFQNHFENIQLKKELERNEKNWAYFKFDSNKTTLMVQICNCNPNITYGILFNPQTDIFRNFNFTTDSINISFSFIKPIKGYSAELILYDFINNEKIDSTFLIVEMDSEYIKDSEKDAFILTFWIMSFLVLTILIVIPLFLFYKKKMKRKKIGEN